MAQLWADKCDFTHGQPKCTDQPYDPLGQNLYAASGGKYSHGSSYHSRNNPIYVNISMLGEVT